MSERQLGLSSSYVVAQLQKALETAVDHPDAATRERARTRLTRWQRVLAGTAAGELDVGSRTPVRNTPAWVTLEVVKGGFATGALAAGGELLPHERTLLARPEISGRAQAAGRAALNNWYLGEAGQGELRVMLASGGYRVNVPEEAVLLTVAWLLQQGDLERAADVLEEVIPFFDRLRFYPVPDAQPLLPSPLVHRKSVGEVREQLSGSREQAQVKRMNQTLSVWVPLYDRAAALLLETVEGDAPAFSGTRGNNGQPEVSGGYPCQRKPSGWEARAAAFVTDCAQAEKATAPSARYAKTESGFGRLRSVIADYLSAPGKLTGMQIGSARRVLAGLAAKTGEVGSARHREMRSKQARLAALPTHDVLRRVVTSRLAALPEGGGVESLALAEHPVSEDEARSFHLPAGAALPPSVRGKVKRAWLAPVETLVAEGVIPSGEVLAQVTPQITSQVRSASLADPPLRRLYGAVYASFAKRRSLLLLNYASQVRLGELPWVAAMESYREKNVSAPEQARQTLEQLVTLALTAFPYEIFPNKLLTELRALSEAAELKLPFVDELATDIFMGSFTEKFLRAAQIAGRVLEGSLYERYYGLPYSLVARIDDVPKEKGVAPVSLDYARLCEQLAGGRGNGSPAANGKVIEQSQILTTQNLAPIFEALGLGRSLGPRLREMAETNLAWLVKQVGKPAANWRTELQRIKNGAYAWRQMLFFLSIAGEQEARRFARAAQERWGGVERLRPALAGLTLVAEGGRFEPDGTGPKGARRYLGWTTERHWMMPPKKGDAPSGFKN